MKHYAYKQLRDNGEYYYGIHSTDNLDDGYAGSGTLFKDKYNSDPSRFTKTIIHFEESRGLIEEFEEVLVDLEMLKDPLCLNLMTGGGSGLPSDETKAKMSASMTGQNNPFFGQKHTSKTKAKMVANQPDKSGAKNGMYGNKHSAEARAKISAGHMKYTQMLWWTHTSGAERFDTANGMGYAYSPHKQSSSFTRMITGSLKTIYGWHLKGADYKSETTCEHCDRTISNTNHTRWHGDNCKLWVAQTHG